MFGSTVFGFLSLCAVVSGCMCDALDKIGEYLNRCNLDLFYDFLKIDFNYTIKLVLLVFLLIFILYLRTGKMLSRPCHDNAESFDSAESLRKYRSFKERPST